MIIIIDASVTFSTVQHLNRSKGDYFITSESVSHGHPDKVADRISDDILDHFLFMNPQAHVACEVMVTKGNVVIAGEVCGVSVNHADIDFLVRKTIDDIGYKSPGFNSNTVKVTLLLQEQSKDILLGVRRGKDIGAGDQGVMYGYAIDETATLIPSPIFYSHKVLKSIADASKDGKLSGLGPDAKTELTVLYSDGKPVKVVRAVLSIQHDESLTQNDVRDAVYPYVVSALPNGWMCRNEHFFVNPTGRFVVGGPECDTGLTGRKIMVDTYGGHIPHGGGSFSGKDPSKVDRSAAYMARYLAKNIVHSGLSTECLVQMSYAIGMPKPLTFSVNTLGTGLVDDERIERCILENVDLSVCGMCDHLSLREQKYSPTSCYGHFGRNAASSFSWENLGLSETLKRELDSSCFEHCI